jgi:hypothetical protein
MPTRSVVPPARSELPHLDMQNPWPYEAVGTQTVITICSIGIGAGSAGAARIATFSSARRSTTIATIARRCARLLAGAAPGGGTVVEQGWTVGVPPILGGLDHDREGVGAQFAAHGGRVAPLPFAVQRTAMKTAVGCDYRHALERTANIPSLNER